MKNKKIFLYYQLKLIIITLLLPAVACSQSGIIAFPGAEGGGMYTTGGRGGKVFFVTSLEDNNEPGSLRYAINQKEKRTILFKISGTIYLKSPLDISNGDLTIAGQSAPGDGICIAHYPVTVSANNVIVRFLRFRLGYIEVAGADGFDAFSGRKSNNVIIDHCSISWSTDECSSFYDNENFTMQWCIISESLRLSGHSKGPHGYGAIWGGVKASYHHNLLAHHDSRTPRFGPGAKFAGKDLTDVRNNVFYNWNGNGSYGGEAMKINLVNNYFKPGPATSERVASKITSIIVKDGKNGFNQIKGIWGTYYVSGNFFPQHPEINTNNWKGVRIEGTDIAKVKSEVPVMASTVNTSDAQKTYKQVLAYAGCSIVRDDVDKRIIEETRTGTAAFIGKSPYNGEGKSKDYPRQGIIDSQLDLKPENAPDDWTPWPKLVSKPSPLDTDDDGIPDEWEKANKLDYRVANSSGRDLNKDYDNLEVYLNSLVSNITKNQQK